jgi:hypothetical protein
MHTYIEQYSRERAGPAGLAARRGRRAGDSVERGCAPVNLYPVEPPGPTLDVVERVLLVEDGDVFRLAPSVRLEQQIEELLIQGD